MAVVAPEVAAKQFLSVVNTIFAYQYVNLTTDPTKLPEAVGFITSSVQDLVIIANSTGLTVQDVNRTLIGVTDCLNKTLSTNANSLLAWNCFESTPPSSPNNAGSFNCEQYGFDMDALLLRILLAITTVFVIVWSFLGKRKSCRLNCCHGFPRAIVPLNMLDSYENRFGNAAAFGVTTVYCTNMLFGSAKSILGSDLGKFIDIAPGFVSILFKMIGTGVIAMSAFPLFACMSTSHKVIGSTFGLLYSCTWFGVMVWTKNSVFTLCTDPDKKTGLLMFNHFGVLPEFLCLLFLAIKFTVMLVKAIRKRKGKWHESALEVHQNFREQYMFTHVKNLLKGVPVDLFPPEKETFKMKLKKKIYKWHPEFKYSIRVISAFVVSGITLYYLMVYLVFIVWYYMAYLLKLVVDSDSFASTIISTFEISMDMVQQIRIHFDIWVSCFYVAITLSAVKTSLVFMNMLAWYRGHMMRLRRGDRSWLPTSIRTLSNSPASLVAASMKYAGFQVAYSAWGFVIFAFLLWIVLGLAISLVLHPLFNGKKTFALALIVKFWPTLLISLVVTFGQRLAAKFCFLHQRGAIISIDNRRAFHITSYYMFFFNIFLGLFSCLLRIIKCVVIGMLFLERVQKSLLPRSFEKMDPGYYAYIGYILTEHSHANPVLCVFFHLLNEQVKNTDTVVVIASRSTVPDELPIKNGDSLKMDLVNTNKERSDRWKIVRNKWNLAYTLLKNPSLARYRKSRDLDVGKVDLANEKEDQHMITEEKEATTPVSV